LYFYSFIFRNIVIGAVSFLFFSSLNIVHDMTLRPVRLF
jgi:hypothetical protein